MKSFSLVALLAIALTTGCGKKDDVVIVGPDGTKITADQDGTSMTIKDEKGNVSTFNADNKGGMSMSDGKGGTVELGQGNVSEADLGVPFYPGSADGTAGMSSKVETDKEKIVTSVRTSKDDLSKVLEFYQPKVMNPSQSSATSGSTKVASISGTLEHGTEITIGATKDGDNDTQIIVTAKHKK